MSKNTDWVIPFEMGQNGKSFPGDHLQTAWKFNSLCVNVFVGTVQNFTSMLQILFELRLFK